MAYTSLGPIKWREDTKREGSPPFFDNTRSVLEESFRRANIQKRCKEPKNSRRVLVSNHSAYPHCKYAGMNEGKKE